MSSARRPGNNSELHQVLPLYLFYQVKREDLQDKQILATNEKYYIADHGIRDNFPKYVVSLDEFDMSRNGIKHRNIRDFLLAEEWS